MSSLRQGRVVVHLVGDPGVACAIGLYQRVKAHIPAIALICTDANSCYRLTFGHHGVPEPHGQSKAQTHLIERSNATIRNTLARFNRRSKPYSKSWARHEATLLLFFNPHLIPTAER